MSDITRRSGSLTADLPPVKEPDAMGVWSDDDETTWLPRSLYPKRIDAIRWAMSQWGVSLPEVRCRSRFMRYQPYVVESWQDGEVVRPGWSEDRWYECEKDDPGAFPVWRLEPA